MLKDNPRGNYGIDQYRPPLCFELAGREYTFVMDDGVDYVLRFLDGKTAEWHLENEEPKQEDYECLKADDTTYLVFFEIVIDLENMLVTRIIAVNGENPKDPYLNNTYIEFGAILKTDGSVTFKRHSYTDEMIGTCMQWCYGSFSTVHIYYCSNFYRITYPRDGSQDPAISEGMDSLVRQLPSSDEPASYIKIKENMYLLNITERNMEKLLGAGGLFRSNTMCFLQNYDRLYLVGRAFGNVTQDGVDSEIRLSFGAYGKFTEAPDGFFSDPNPYIV